MNRNVTMRIESQAHGQATRSSPPADRASSIVECPSAPTRELAQRMSGTVEIRLLWHPGIDQVGLSVCDQATGAGFHIEVAPGNAFDAYHHPYAYAARCRAETTMLYG